MSMRYPGGLIASSPVNAAYPSGVWTQAQTQPYAAQNVWMRDQFWPNTTLLLQGNGTNGAQNNTFLDSSTNNFTITRNGNTTQGSFTPYEANGYWSNYFDGSGDQLSAPVGAISSVGSSDFSIECFVYFLRNTNTFSQGLVSYGVAGSTTGTSFLSFQTDPSGYPAVAYATGASLTLTSSVLPSTNQWTHLVVCRSGSTLSIFVNGVRAATTTTSATVGASGDALTIGGQWFANNSGRQLQGYISNARIVRGSSAYDATQSNITVPSAPLTAITNTSLLTCQSNRFIDNSTNAYAVTAAGDASVQAFQPFPGATTWSGSVLGGSGYFDGSGDYLNGPNSGQFAPTGDFTISMWFYPTSFAASYYVLAGSWNTGTSDEWLIQYDNTGAIRFLTTTDSTFSAAGVVKLNQWQFLTVSRSGSTVTGYINGTSFRSYTLTGTVGSATKTVYIGAQQGTTWPYVGWISDYRLVSGSAQSATPPTSPATAISGTNTLLNFTNAGIFDSAMMNNLETVGNAQVSTSVVKYGTGSMAFDGSGDYLVRPDAEFLRLSSGDFTIEAWVYLTGNQPQFDGGVASYGATTTFAGWTVGISGSSAGGTLNRLLYGVNASASGGAPLYGVNGIALNTWTHIAVTKSGTTVRLFINGSLDNSGTVTATPTTSTSYFFYVGTQAYDPTATTRQFAGYIDDLRITKGAARYIGNFTPPVARMPQQ